MHIKLKCITIFYILLYSYQISFAGSETIEPKYQVTPAQPSFFFKLLYPIMPWRFTTPTPAIKLSKTTTKKGDIVDSSNLDEILQSIEPSSPDFKINNGSLSLNDTEVVVVENGSESFRIIDDEHVIIPINSATPTMPMITTGANNTVGRFILVFTSKNTQLRATVF